MPRATRLFPLLSAFCRDVADIGAAPVWLALYAVVTTGSGAAAQTSPPRTITEVFTCDSIRDVAARAACYDSAVGKLRRAYESGDITVLDREGVAQLRRDAFGKSVVTRDDAAPSRQSFRIGRVIAREGGRRAYVMTDGQVWMEVEAEPGVAPSPGEDVTIRRAALGSFLLFPAHGRARRVRREE